MNPGSIPTLAEFLEAPYEEVAKVAPATMVYAPGGTRRQAVFEGIEPWSEEYMQWGQQRTLACCAMIFQHGIQHLFVPVFISTTFNEVNRLRDKVFNSIHLYLSSSEILADYARLGWRVRLIGTESVPELSATAEKLRLNTPGQINVSEQKSRTLYWVVVPESEAPWQQLLVAAQDSQAKTRAEVMRALYGEEIPLATLYLAFGKPMISLEIIPPLLMGQLQCYWSQQPGYTLTKEQLRTILYDYAYLRTTWREDKLDRAKEALAHRQAWEEGPILGLGMQLGPFWYPAPMSSSAWAHDE